MVSVITAKKDDILQTCSLDSMFLHYYLGYSMEISMQIILLDKIKLHSKGILI